MLCHSWRRSFLAAGLSSRSSRGRNRKIRVKVRVAEAFPGGLSAAPLRVSVCVCTHVCIEFVEEYSGKDDVDVSQAVGRACAFIPKVREMKYPRRFSRLLDLRPVESSRGPSLVETNTGWRCQCTLVDARGALSVPLPIDDRSFKRIEAATS